MRHFSRPVLIPVLLLAMAAACSPGKAVEGDAAVAPAAPESQAAVAGLPPLPPADPLDGDAPRTLRIDVLDVASVAAIEGPTPGTFVVEGYAPADWFFEAVFPIRVEVDGQPVAEVLATSLDDWTNGAPHHPYRARIEALIEAETAATLVLEEDMPGEGNDPRQVRLPLTLVPHVAPRP